MEDDGDLRTYLAEILRGLNYDVVAVPSAQSALTVLLQEDRRVDLLLTDIVMPGITDASWADAPRGCAQSFRSCT